VLIVTAGSTTVLAMRMIKVARGPGPVDKASSIVVTVEIDHC